MVGTVSVTELEGINPAYDDAQADTQVWNIQSQTWEALTPGVNSNTSATANDRWSIESRFREAVRSQFPTGTFWLIKHAVDSTLVPVSAKDLYTALMIDPAKAEYHRGMEFIPTRSTTENPNDLFRVIESADHRLLLLEQEWLP